MDDDFYDNDHFLTRFLSDVANKTPPNQDDLKAVTKALIEMNDHGASFKKAFGLTDSRGRKPNKQLEISKLESFQSMSEGWLGNAPLWLISFLSKVNQELQPNTNDLEKVAISLIKMRDKEESLKSAFDLKNKTGNKELGITIMPWLHILRSEKWAIYHSYNKCKTKGYERLDYIREFYGYDSTRQIERIIKEIREIRYINEPITKDQKKYWGFYFATRKNLNNTPLQNIVKSICEEQNISGWEVYFNFSFLYEEVILNKKYVLVTRGYRDYPILLRKRIIRELKDFYSIVTSVHAISFENGLIIQRLHRKNEALDVISSQTGILQSVIDCYLKSLERRECIKKIEALEALK